MENYCIAFRLICNNEKKTIQLLANKGIRTKHFFCVECQL